MSEQLRVLTSLICSLKSTAVDENSSSSLFLYYLLHQHQFLSKVGGAWLFLLHVACTV